MPECILATQEISVRFGHYQALSDLSLEVARGTVHAVIGPNGAGKTTLFNALSGVQPPSSGRVIFAGRDITQLPVSRRVHLGMARSFQVTNIFQNLTVAENLRLAAQATRGATAWAFWHSPATLAGSVAELLRITHLVTHASERAGDLSHAAQRALEIGMTLASDPQLVFLDEPLAGMSIDDVARTKQLIHNLAPQRTVVLIEHNMKVVLDISDRITVLAQGRLIAEGPPAAIRADPAVREAYLGSAA